MISKITVIHIAGCLIMFIGSARGAEIYLNDSNISVALGASMAAEPFQNRSTIDSLASVIDAPTADSSENHNQATHVWVSGGVLELDFDFGIEYDLQLFHFWNYFTEGFDVDTIDFMFFDSDSNLVGSVLDFQPAVGGNPIFAEDVLLSFPTNVQFVNVVLAGSNDQVDFNNIGFTAVVSIPEPSSFILAGCGIIFLLGYKRKRKTISKT